MNTIYLITDPPKFCPACARPYKWDAYGARVDFLNGCSQACTCGAQFQYMPPNLIAKAAMLNPQGDLLVRD